MIEKAHILMAFLFAVFIVLIDFGLGLSLWELSISLAGCYMVCLIHYELVSKRFIKDEEEAP